ncbi:MAG: NRDE family protein [Comamonadaceae bacterium]|nr:NRDE family protein [Comamonadaceae bacterium]
MFIYYRLRPEAAALAASGRCAAMQQRLGAGDRNPAGASCSRADDAMTWMEIYEGVSDAAAFEASLGTSGRRSTAWTACWRKAQVAPRRAIRAMCLILLAWRARPATTRWWWPPTATSSSRAPPPPPISGPSAPQVLAGRDLQGGGTWLGVTRDGPLRRPHQLPRSSASDGPTAPSRGELVSRFLRGDDGARRLPRAGIADRSPRPTTASTCVFGTIGSRHRAALFLATAARAAANSASGHLRLVQPSAGYARGPRWRSGKSALGPALSPHCRTTRRCWRCCADDRIAPDDALPRTGVSLEWERLLSAAFVRSAGLRHALVHRAPGR